MSSVEARSPAPPTIENQHRDDNQRFELSLLAERKPQLVGTTTEGENVFLIDPIPADARIIFENWATDFTARPFYHHPDDLSRIEEEFIANLLTPDNAEMRVVKALAKVTENKVAIMGCAIFYVGSRDEVLKVFSDASPPTLKLRMRGAKSLSADEISEITAKAMDKYKGLYPATTPIIYASELSVTRTARKVFPNAFTFLAAAAYSEALARVSGGGAQDQDSPVVVGQTVRERRNPPKRGLFGTGEYSGALNNNLEVLGRLPFSRFRVIHGHNTKVSPTLDSFYIQYLNGSIERGIMPIVERENPPEIIYFSVEGPLLKILAKNPNIFNLIRILTKRKN